MAARLVIDRVRLGVLAHHFDLGGPRLLPCRAVIHRDDVLQVVGSDTCETFDEMQVLARALIVGFRREVRHINDERVAFPVTSGVAMPLPDLRWDMWGSGHRYDALPPFLENRRGARRLHDLLRSEER